MGLNPYPSKTGSKMTHTYIKVQDWAKNDPIHFFQNFVIKKDQDGSFLTQTTLKDQDGSNLTQCIFEEENRKRDQLSIKKKDEGTN